VLFCMICVVCVLCLIVVPLSTDKSPSAVKINNTNYESTETSVPRVEFEHTIPVFDRVKAVHALNRATTVMGDLQSSRSLLHCYLYFI
jgi:hypothetical protein